jgi:hypothetical protein
MDLTSDSWKEVGKGIDKTNRMIGWVIADWLNAYPSEWGNIYDEATELTGLSYERLKKLKSRKANGLLENCTRKLRAMK